MKQGIHPDYQIANVHCSCGNTFQTRSTVGEIRAEICSNCHPFYTGKQKLVDTGGRVEIGSDPVAAVTAAQVVVTDTWVSMGREEEAARRAELFAPYAVTSELLARAEADAIVLHCLPAYRGKEIDAVVIDGPQSVVWDEAENRRHVHKAMLIFLDERRET